MELSKGTLHYRPSTQDIEWILHSATVMGVLRPFLRILVSWYSLRYIASTPIYHCMPYKAN